MNVRKQIRLLRRTCGWTQAKLGSRVGLARSSIANIESGHRTPSDRNQEKIFRVLQRAQPR